MEERNQDDKRQSSEAANKVVTWSALVAGIGVALTIVGGSTGILQWLYRENNELRKEIAAIRIESAQNQVTKREMQTIVGEMSSRLEKRLDRLEARILSSGNK